MPNEGWSARYMRWSPEKSDCAKVSFGLCATRLPLVEEPSAVQPPAAQPRSVTPACAVPSPLADVVYPRPWARAVTATETTAEAPARSELRSKEKMAAGV